MVTEEADCVSVGKLTEGDLCRLHHWARERSRNSFGLSPSRELPCILFSRLYQDTRHGCPARAALFLSSADRVASLSRRPVSSSVL